MIKRLYIHGFRCLENFSLDLDGYPTALLIGKNGAGKSTVLQGLMLLQSICRGPNRVGALLSASDFSHNRTDHPLRIEIELSLGQRHFVYMVSFEWPANLREARILDEALKVDGTPIFERHHSQIQIGGVFAFGLDWHVFALPVINERPGERSVADLKAFLANMLLIAPVPRNMTGFSEEPTPELHDDASNYASCLRGLLGQKPAAYGHLDSYLKEVIPDFSSIETVERGEKGTQLIVRFERENPRANIAIEFGALSDGEKCFFLGAYLIATGAVGLPVFCFWDEPDNHLSISEVGHFILGLRRLEHHAAQLVVTSHHPETIRSFADDNTFVLTRKSHLEPTMIRPLSDVPHQGDLIHALIRDDILN